GWRATKSKCDERSSGAKRRICVICVSFFFLPTPMILTPHEITSIRRKIPVFDASDVYVLPRGHLPSRLRL
ncbi:MAG: hypothetical protein O0W99_06580, partial [Methanocorpusculum sp.]|nr:hypothetical protein [Methanocorpusculum sp.]